jgi:hypothetical protein
MLTINSGTLTINSGRLTVDGLLIEPGAALHNDAEVYTTTTVSDGEITGNGTLWAHIACKAIGGVIAPLHTIIYYGYQAVKRRFLQIQSGSCVVTSPSGHGTVVS